MNILYIALLFCVICHVFASETGLNIFPEPVTGGFEDAIKKSDVKAAMNIFGEGNDAQKEYYGKYLISLERGRLVGLIRSSEGYDKGWLLSIIELYAENELIEKVFKEVELPNHGLVVVANNADLVCTPGKFINFLGRITDKGYQKELLY